MKVSLIKLDKIELNPRSFECWYDTDRNNKISDVSGAIPIKANKKEDVTSCQLTFDSYDWDFSLLVNGIETKERPILVPPIHFKRSSDWSLKAGGPFIDPVFAFPLYVRVILKLAKATNK